MSVYIIFFVSLVLVSSVSIIAIVGLRKKFFSEGYAGLWFFLSLGLYLIIIFPDEIKHFSVLLGFQNNTSFLFLLANIFLIMVTMIQSIHISKLRKQVKDLSQYVAQNSSND